MFEPLVKALAFTSRARVSARPSVWTRTFERSALSFDSSERWKSACSG